MSSAESEALASGILKALGGKNNIVKMDYCATRLRFEVHSYASVDEAAAKAVGMGGIYDLTRFWGTDSDDMVLRCAPLAYLQENGIANKPALAKAEENSVKAA